MTKLVKMKNSTVAVIATTPRLNNLLQFSLPAISQQTCMPDYLLIVSDKRPLTKEEQAQVQSVVPKVTILFLTNINKQGAAGSWNTAIQYASKQWVECYIGILDDDDIWYSNHIEECLSNSSNGNADLILSGMNVVINSITVDSNIPNNLIADDFLAGNPGWQGSNTFIKLSVLNKVGGFTDGLISSNDRDLAIRVLDSINLHIAYTGQVTVDWQCNQSLDALSAPGSPQKLKGSAQFYLRYQHRMNEKIKTKFFMRLENLFNINRTQLLNAVADLT